MFMPKQWVWDFETITVIRVEDPWADIYWKCTHLVDNSAKIFAGKHLTKVEVLEAINCFEIGPSKTFDEFILEKLSRLGYNHPHNVTYVLKLLELRKKRKIRHYS